MSISNKYLVQALRGYRQITYGQFDQTTETIVPVTQDAAEEIERLNQRVAELERGVVVGFKEGTAEIYGMTGAIRWSDIARLVKETKGEPVDSEIVTLIAEQGQLKYILKHKE